MKNKELLFASGVAALVLLSVLLAIGIGASLYRLSGAHVGTGPQGYITVSASGTSYGLPSQALIDITVNGTGPTVHEAVANLSASVTVLNSTLYSFVSGNMSRITTTSYYTVKTYNRSSYTAVEAIEVTVPDIGAVSALLGNLSAMRNVYVSSVNAQLSSAQVSQLRSQALKQALLNATMQAQDIASPMQIRLTNVSISGYVVYPYSLAVGSRSLVEQGSTTPTFYPGRGQVRESVTAVFSYG